MNNKIEEAKKIELEELEHERNKKKTFMKMIDE